MKTNKYGHVVFEPTDNGYIIPLGHGDCFIPTWQPEKPLTQSELRYALDAADVRAELHMLGGALKDIDSARMYGVPLRELSKTELMACCVILAAQTRHWVDSAKEREALR